MTIITSRQHPLVKTFRQIARGDNRLALIDGWHLIDDAMRADIEFQTVAVTARAAADHRRTLDSVRARGLHLVEVSPGIMDALSPVQTPSGIVALVCRRDATLTNLLRPGPALTVVAVDMQDPGNVGAVVRSAEAGGATGVAFAGASADPWGWKAIRAAMGSTLRVPILQEKNAVTLLTGLRSAGVKLIATVPRGGETMNDVDMRGDVAIVIGGEGAGLPHDITASADQCASIPMQPQVQSLNAAVAAALLVYEARRQREVGLS